MLSIAPLRGSGNYYEQLAKDDYYATGGRGRYMGQGAKALHLQDEVRSRDKLRNLFAGKSPDGKEDWVQQQRGKTRQPGWDLCWSAPKSVSVAFAIADDELRGKILEAHRNAVQAAVTYLEDEALWTRRGKGGHRVEKAGAVCVAYDHFTSRAQDMNLHSHVLFLNTAVRKDGSTGTIKSRALYEHLRAGDTVYRAQLGCDLQQLGLTLRKGEHSFELEAVPSKVCDAFSKRNAAIKETMAREGTFGAKAAARAALTTRQTKEHLPLSELIPRWRDEAGELGLHVIQPTPRGKQPARVPTPEVTLCAARELAAREASFRERDLLSQAGKELEHLGLGADQLRRAVRSQLESEEIERIAPDGRFSTKDHLATERQLLDLAQAAKNDRSHIVSAKNLAAIEKRAKLSHEQHEALHHVTLGTGGIALVSGLAGTGKTSLLRAAREAWEKQGFQVLGATPSKTAARELRTGAGIETRTIASLRMVIDRTLKDELQHHAKQLIRAAQGKKTWQFDRSGLGPKSVLVIDEASMASTADLSNLVRGARARGAKVVMAGDPRQLAAIEAGGGFAALEKVLGAAQLSDIRRQNGWQRQASLALADGDQHTALSLYAEHGKAKLFETRMEAKRALVADWAKKRPDPSAALMLAGTRADVADLNRLAQAEKKTRGELGATHVTVNGQKFHPGDRFRLTKNSTALDLANGDRGTVKRVIPAAVPGYSKLVLELDAQSGEKPRTVTLQTKAYSHLELGYAETIHSAQGQTRETSYVLAGGWTQNRELSYVGLTRHTTECNIYLAAAEAGEDLEHLLREMQKSRTKTMALEVAERLPGRDPAFRRGHDNFATARLPQHDLRSELEPAEDRLGHAILELERQRIEQEERERHLHK